MTQTTQFRVLDLDCPTCASTVERALAGHDGVDRVEVHYATGRVEISHDPSVVDSDDLESTIERQGYTPQVA